MRTNETTTAKWIKLEDGTFGAQLRVGGRGAEYVGAQVTICSKAGARERVVLTSVVKDWGVGDVVEFRCSREVQP